MTILSKATERFATAGTFLLAVLPLVALGVLGH